MKKTAIAGFVATALMFSGMAFADAPSKQDRQEYGAVHQQMRTEMEMAKAAKTDDVSAFKRATGSIGERADKNAGSTRFEPSEFFWH